MAETVEGKTYLPNDFGDRSGDIEGESARICEHLAAHALSQEDRRPRLVTGDDSIELSAGVVDRLYLSDVVEYRKRRRRVADEALSDIVADAQMFGEYDADPEEYREILRAVRHDG